MSHLSTLIERYDTHPDKRVKVEAIVNMIEFLAMPNPPPISTRESTREIATASMRIFEYANKLPHTIGIYNWEKREFKPQRLGDELIQAWLWATDIYDRAIELQEQGKDPNMMLKNEIEELMNWTANLLQKLMERERKAEVSIGL